MAKKPKRSSVKYDPARGIREVEGIRYGGDEGYALAYYSAMLRAKPKHRKRTKK